MQKFIDWGLSNASFAILCATTAVVLVALLSHECYYQLRRFRGRLHRRFWQSQLPKGLQVQGLEPATYARDTSAPRMALHLSVCQACVNRDRCRAASQSGQRCELPYCPLRGTVQRFERRHRSSRRLAAAVQAVRAEN